MEIIDNAIDNIKITETDVPSLIQEQFSILSEYSSNYEHAKKKAEEVNKKALESQEKGVHFFKMKNSIEDLQDNQVALSESNKINMELQEKSLELQKKITEIMQYFFGLGVANIAMNRCVVKELQMRLDDASQNEIDDMARGEILNVIKQLKSQEDLYIKTMEITFKVKEHDNKLNSQESKDLEYDLLIESLKEKIFIANDNIESLQKENTKNKKVINILGITVIISIILGIFAIIQSIVHFI